MTVKNFITGVLYIIASAPIISMLLVLLHSNLGFSDNIMYFFSILTGVLNGLFAVKVGKWLGDSN